MDNRECFTDDNELNLYLDNEIRGGRKESLDRHLAGCPECSYRYSFSSSLKNIVKSSCRRERAPQHLRDLIQERIAGETAVLAGGFWEKLRSMLTGRPLVPIAAAALLLIVFSSAVLFRPSKVPTTPLISDMVGEHIEYLSGKFDEYGIKSTDVREVEGWLASNGGLMVKFPASENMPSLSGACIFDEDGNKITSVFFGEGVNRISLFMTSGIRLQSDPKSVVLIKDVPVSCGRHGGENYAAWNSQGLYWIMIGSLPRESLMTLAAAFIPG